ncbi:MAG: YwaF family protein [Clostridia bacterium]|nr:YwaF family protein [Clostridia bacterium]
MFNFWYFFWIAICVGVFFGLYFLLRKRTQKTQKTVLFCVLLFALLLHFLKALFPPYSVDESRLYRDIWFINICGANIFLFPFLFFSKNKWVKDYMFYIGVFSGILAMLYPIEPIQKVDQAAEWLDVVRFYIHHAILWIVPLLMVLLKLHTPSYKRVLSAPTGLLCVMLFIMLNQIVQSELGFVPLRGDDLFAIGYKNTSYIWGPGNDFIGKFLSKLCPNIFKFIPVGEFAGQTKYWPWVWLIVPAYVLVTPLAFAVSLIFDWKNFKADALTFKEKYCAWKNA